MDVPINLFMTTLCPVLFKWLRRLVMATSFIEETKLGRWMIFSWLFLLALVAGVFWACIQLADKPLNCYRHTPGLEILAVPIFLTVVSILSAKAESYVQGLCSTHFTNRTLLAYLSLLVASLEVGIVTVLSAQAVYMVYKL